MGGRYRRGVRQLIYLAIIAAPLLMAGCAADRRIDTQVKLRDRINIYQTLAHDMYRIGHMPEYQYFRGVADGVATSRDILEDE